MPIDTVQHFMHVTTRKNKQVMHNVSRLWTIGQQATSDQDILDALHPWNDSKELYFYNNLPRLLFISGVLTCLFGWIIHHYIPFIVSFTLGALCCFLAYLIYENDDPIDEVIAFLEERIMLLRYDLHFNKMPGHMAATSNSILVMSKLRQAFPLFSQGNASNEIVQFAATTWHDGETEHQVLVFHYHYIDKISFFDSKGNQQKITEKHTDQWGVFIFQMPPLGFAASNKHDQFAYPYHQKWQSSDILVNEKIGIFGSEQHQLARIISPRQTLKLSNFFEYYNGDLIYHFQENLFCYCGDQNLLQISHRKREIRDISTLRGHLRTLTMPEYEKFKQSMLKFIS